MTTGQESHGFPAQWTYSKLLTDFSNEIRTIGPEFLFFKKPISVHLKSIQKVKQIEFTLFYIQPISL